jgi:hypothetical protein
MALFQKYCDVEQGYDFKKDVQTPIGYITSLKIGDTTLKADQTVKDPLSPETDLPVVAVLSGATWDLGVTDPLYFTGQVSVYNKQQIKLLVIKDLSKVDVTFKVAVYEYDPIEKKYFKCLLGTDDADLNGLLEKRGGELNLSVAEDASKDVPSPQNFSFQTGINPQPSAQVVTVATSFSDKVVKSWGMKVEK